MSSSHNTVEVSALLLLLLLGCFAREMHIHCRRTFSQRENGVIALIVAMYTVYFIHTVLDQISFHVHCYIEDRHPSLI